MRQLDREEKVELGGRMSQYNEEDIGVVMSRPACWCSPRLPQTIPSQRLPGGGEAGPGTLAGREREASCRP